MHPFPLHAQIEFPGGRMQERPWWLWDSIQQKFFRQDSIRAGTVDTYNELAALDKDEAATIDKRMPIKPPRLGAGQVWLLEAEQVTFEVLLELNLPKTRTIGLDDKFWRIGDTSYSFSEIERLLIRPGFDLDFRPGFVNKASFLVFDPIRPYQVPWASS